MAKTNGIGDWTFPSDAAGWTRFPVAGDAQTVRVAKGQPLASVRFKAGVQNVVRVAAGGAWKEPLPANIPSGTAEYPTLIVADGDGPRPVISPPRQYGVRLENRHDVGL